MNNTSLKTVTLPKTLAELKTLCKKYGLTNSVIYKKNYKKYGLPAHPERLYKTEWISYKDFYDIQDFLPYDQLCSLISDLGIKNQSKYKEFVKNIGDSTIPLDPPTVYKDQWENWYKFLGKQEPFKPEYMPEEYTEWTIKITDFLRNARGGSTKESNLYRFVRLYIMVYDNSLSPITFLTKAKHNSKAFKEVVESLEKDPTKRKFVTAVNEFLNHIIKNDLTIVDEDTGDIFIYENAKNPFLSFLDVYNIPSSSIRSETTKPCLQYHFVRKVQNWIIPSTAQNFRDLNHIQKFDADWVRVDKEIIDPNDPDCVYKIIENQIYLWIPTDWIHTYALTKVPLRGRQIAYNDSGEADEYLADLNDKNQIVWVKNNSLFSGLTKNQSFIKRMENDQLGIYTTTNKTNNNGHGYSIPWIPEDLAYWLIKLRKWQQKYNPIKAPTAWIDCVRTNLNDTQKIAKGINCFLFRRFNDFEPANIVNALTPRLAASLFHIQPRNLQLAELKGNSATVGNYISRYTPHSMRVSLITAYVIELGIPIEIVMKIVGHSSVIMSIYYCKVNNEDIRKRLEAAEKISLKSEAEAIQKVIEQHRIEDVKNNLVASNEELLNALTNKIPAGNYVFRDYGICPFAASRCDDGGPQIQTSSFNAPTPQGYLGSQNCLRCRHFITGPAFLGGLLAITNEILLQSNDQSERCSKLQYQIDDISQEITHLERQEYLTHAKNEDFEHTEYLSNLESDLRNYESEYEISAKKLDMLLCDIQAAYAHITRCHNLLNKDIVSEQNKGEFDLITHSDSELVIEFEEVTHFQQLQEVCENASIYKSCNADIAIFPRTQLLDRMLQLNQLIPRLFTLSKDQQLAVGNQISNILMQRLKSWEKVGHVIECKTKLNELDENASMIKTEIELTLVQAQKLIEG
ncbi:VPA1269 family protein [Acinetobacter pittii]|uniref:gamma-mobile-trio integrase GmtZ n=1 Tax=Acinetobacter pittii TaxID=48296 RepID=UPI00062AA820|nr:VPA1269 family protein [Acinetobacter pittii]TGU85402.1 integrase [Acinetobacter pittii]